MNIKRIKEHCTGFYINARQVYRFALYGKCNLNILKVVVLQALFIRTCKEVSAAVIVCSHGTFQERNVLWVCAVPFWKICLLCGYFGVKIADEKVHKTKSVAVRTASAVSADWCLKVVINNRIVVWIACQLAFLHKPVIWICTAAEHIVTNPVHTACKLSKAHSVAVFFADERSAVLCHLIARSRFARSIRNVVKHTAFYFLAFE